MTEDRAEELRQASRLALRALAVSLSEQRGETLYESLLWLSSDAEREAQLEALKGHG